MMQRYSAVIIARNEEKNIEKSVKSILNQSIKPYRLIVVDDNSTDATPEILNSMGVTVERIPKHGGNRYSDTLAQVRNVGLTCVRNDPVDWVYSGDADITLPPKYCEIIMKHARENNAYIGAGTVDNKDELPQDGCRLIVHDWLKSVGMETKWESIYLCIMALVHGKNTLVRHAADCTVTLQRAFDNSPDRQYRKGRLAKRMGASLDILLYSSAVSAKQYGLITGLNFFKGGLEEEMRVSEVMGQMYRTMVRNNFLRHLGRRHKMLQKSGENLICHPPNSS